MSEHLPSIEVLCSISSTSKGAWFVGGSERKKAALVGACLQTRNTVWYSLEGVPMKLECMECGRTVNIDAEPKEDPR